jgi:hypothetical protein
MRVLAIRSLSLEEWSVDDRVARLAVSATSVAVAASMMAIASWQPPPPGWLPSSAPAPGGG